jgi:hypothetical protein
MYGIVTTLTGITFGTVLARTVDAHMNAGFGVLSDIDLRFTMRFNFNASNPKLDHDALMAGLGRRPLRTCNRIARKETPELTSVHHWAAQIRYGLVGNPEVLCVAEASDILLRNVCAPRTKCAVLDPVV